MPKCFPLLLPSSALQLPILYIFLPRPPAPVGVVFRGMVAALPLGRLAFLPSSCSSQRTLVGCVIAEREGRGGEGRRWQWHEIIPPLCFPQEENMYYNTAFNLTSTEKSGFQRRLISHLSIPLSKTGLRSANPVLLQELGGESWNYPYEVLNSSGTCLLPHKFYFPTQWYSNSAPGRWKHSITFIFPPPTRMPHVAFLGRRLPTRPFSSS